MGQVSKFLRRYTGGYLHWCPGCEEMHPLPDSWQFDKNVDCPTFTPSFKHTSHDPKLQGLESPYIETPFICHYVLTRGVMHFEKDSSHAMAGLSVPLPEPPEGYRD